MIARAEESLYGYDQLTNHIESLSIGNRRRSASRNAMNVMRRNIQDNYDYAIGVMEEVDNEDDVPMDWAFPTRD